MNLRRRDDEARRQKILAEEVPRSTHVVGAALGLQYDSARGTGETADDIGAIGCIRLEHVNNYCQRIDLKAQNTLLVRCEAMDVISIVHGSTCFRLIVDEAILLTMNSFRRSHYFIRNTPSH